MEIQSQEARIHLTIGAMRQNRKLSRRAAAKVYNARFSTLTDRINGRAPLKERRPATHKLTELEEEIIVQHILELDTRGFGPRLADVEDMANNVLESRTAARVGYCLLIACISSNYVVAYILLGIKQTLFIWLNKFAEAEWIFQIKLLNI